jgi:hypothetical protein
MSELSIADQLSIQRTIFFSSSFFSSPTSRSTTTTTKHHKKYRWWNLLSLFIFLLVIFELVMLYKGYKVLQNTKPPVTIGRQTSHFIQKLILLV